MSTSSVTIFGLVRSRTLARALPGGRQLLGTVVALSAALNTLLLSGSIFMLMVYDEVLPSRSLVSLVGLLAMLAIAYAFQGAVEHQRHCLVAHSGDCFEQQLAPHVFQRMLRAELQNRGDAASQMVQDLGQLRAFLTGSGAAVILDLPWTVLFLGVLFVLHWILGVVCLLGAGLLVGLTILADRVTTPQLEQASRQHTARLEFVESSRRNAEVIRALGMSTQVLDRFRQLGAAQAAYSDQAGRRLSSMRIFSKSFRLLLQSLILATGAALVISGDATGGVIIASSILSSRALAPIDAAIASWKGLIGARQAWNRLAVLLAETHEPQVRTELPRPCRSLSVHNLTAIAPDSQVTLFRDVQFQLCAGEALAIVGPSGSGKSSVARALVGINSPVRGSVRLDGATLDQWHEDVVGSFVGYLPQDFQLFDGTVAQNIARFDPTARSEEIVAAATMAGIHDLIVALPNGYETMIGQSARTLSTGQRQRIALARALFRDPFLLVLDEPNSNLDLQGDLALNAMIAAARERGAIVIVVAHRPSALVHIDKLLWLEAGTVRAFGDKDEILPRIIGAPPQNYIRAVGAS